jgi:DNA-binding protein YbaB
LDSSIEVRKQRGLEDSGDSLLEAKYKKLKKEHANTKETLAATKVQLADKKEFLNVTMKGSFIHL